MANISGDPPATIGVPPPPLEVLVDRISDIPEPLLVKILSLLPIHRAAQTSCLSRHFRKLWTALPSLYFDHAYFGQTLKFHKMVDRALLSLCRDSSASLGSVCISNDDSRSLLPSSYLTRWMDRFNVLGVKHLSLTLQSATLRLIWSLIFSIKSLESLRISVPDCKGHRDSAPKNISCTRLKSLYMCQNVTSASLTKLVSGLPVLEFLELRGIDQNTIEISSQSLKTLKLHCSARKMKLCFPNLDCIYLLCEASRLEMYQGEMPLVSKAEFILDSPIEKSVPSVGNMLKSVSNAVELYFETKMQYVKAYLHCCEMPLAMPRLECLKLSSEACCLRLFQVEMPVLRKADIQLFNAGEEFVSPMRDLLKCVENVLWLKLYIGDHNAEPFRIFGPNKQPPLFPRLVYFELCSCCHEATIEDVICLLENSPVLNCLKMKHKDAFIYPNVRKNQVYWHSKLPRNSEGNFGHACFTDLHIKNEKGRVIEMLSRSLASNRILSVNYENRIF